MLKIRIIAVGKTKSRPIRELVGDYTSRIKHYISIELAEVKNASSTIKSLKRGDCLVVCDERGKNMRSTELASFLDEKKRGANENLIFYIGGPDGVEPEIRKKAKEFLSLSKMTFPHEFAQAILLEQIYRACTILNNESYHK